MLKVIAYMNLPPLEESTHLLEHIIRESGGELIGLYRAEPPPLNRVLNRVDVLLAGDEPISLVWAFLLRLKSIRPQGNPWPKVVISAGPIIGHYIPEIGRFDEDEYDYFYEYPQYRELYDISLEHVDEDMASCFAVLQLEQLAQLNSVQNQWILTDGRTDYGRLTFTCAEYVPLSSPQVVCHFQAYSPFSHIRSQLEEGQSSTTHLQCKSIGQAVLVDRFLIDPDRFKLFISGEEARILL